ncbi:MAG: geranylgeranyl reductase family protein [Thermodesulfobacteriota bacterium]
MNSKDRYDVVVVGGGPAGSTAAALLAKEGFEVCLIEKARFPRQKICAGLITLKTIHILQKIFGITYDFLIREGIITHSCRNYSIWNTKKEIAKGSPEFVSHFVERDRYDEYWANQASNAGARILMGEKLVSFDLSEKKIVTNQGTSLIGKWIIGADGIFSRIRHELARRKVIPDSYGDGLAPALELRIPKSRSPLFLHYPVLYYGFNSWGYAWSFPGNDMQTLGMCGLNRKSGVRLRQCFERFLRFQGISSPADCSIKGWAVPYGNYLSKPGGMSTLLIGDAAGFADPVLGEGIYYAHKSALLAARAIIDTRTRCMDTAARYAELLSERVLVEMRYAKFWRGIIFSAARMVNYGVLGILMNRFSKYARETIQGKRTFRWLRSIPTE